jgi:hypothetical protein
MLSRRLVAEPGRSEASCRRARLTIHNDGAGAIGAIYAKPAGNRRWGADLLGGRPLGAGEGDDVAPRSGPAARYDVWIEYTSGAGHYLGGMNLSACPRLGVTEFGVRPI